MYTTQTNPNKITDRYAVRVWYSPERPKFRYFTRDQRAQLKQYILSLKNFKEVSIIDPVNYDRKVQNELTKGYYDIDKYKKYFNYAPKRIYRKNEAGSAGKKLAGTRHKSAQ